MGNPGRWVAVFFYRQRLSTKTFPNRTSVFEDPRSTFPTIYLFSGKLGWVFPLDFCQPPPPLPSPYEEERPALFKQTPFSSSPGSKTVFKTRQGRNKGRPCPERGETRKCCYPPIPILHTTRFHRFFRLKKEKKRSLVDNFGRKKNRPSVRHSIFSLLLKNNNNNDRLFSSFSLAAAAAASGLGKGREKKNRMLISLRILPWGTVTKKKMDQNGIRFPKFSVSLF